MTTNREFSTVPVMRSQPAAGDDVFTDDGLPVGTVREIDDGFMRIAAHLRPDFWLRVDDAMRSRVRR